MVCLTVFLSTVAAVSAQQPVKAQTTETDWIGTYGYTKVFERNPNSGYVNTIEYSLVISKKGNSLVARFTAEGYQTSDDYECTVKATGNQLDVYYLKDLQPSDIPAIKSRLKKNQLIGSLIKTIVRRKTRYVYKDKLFLEMNHPAIFKKKS